MRKITAAVLAASLLLGGCNIVNTEPGHESVIVDKPYLFGEGGVRKETFKVGRQFTWLSSSAVQINMQNLKAEEVFDDLMTSDTVPVDFRTTLQLRVTNPSELVDKYGVNTYYINNLQRQYQALVRDEAKKYTMNELLTGTGTATKMETNVRLELDKIVKTRNLPFIVADLSIGRAVPNKNVLDQIDLTAAQQQRSKTMVEQEKAEVQRMRAEQARAAADNAYREKMSLNPDQFLQLEGIKRYSESCAKGTNCTFMFGATNTSMLVPQGHK